MKDYSVIDGLKKDMNDKTYTIFDKGYNQGYEQGYKDGQNIEQSNATVTKEEVAKIEYNRGLNDTWKVARKIYSELTTGQLKYIFGRAGLGDIIKNYSAAECINKIKEYEEKTVTRQSVIKSQLLDIMNGQNDPVTADEIIEILEQMGEKNG